MCTVYLVIINANNHPTINIFEKEENAVNMVDVLTQSHMKALETQNKPAVLEEDVEAINNLSDIFTNLRSRVTHCSIVRDGSHVTERAVVKKITIDEN